MNDQQSEAKEAEAKYRFIQGMDDAELESRFPSRLDALQEGMVIGASMPLGEVLHLLSEGRTVSL